MNFSGIVHKDLRHDFFQSAKNIDRYCWKYAIFLNGRLLVGSYMVIP